VKPEQGVKIHDTITRLEYKEDNGDFLKAKARMCVRGDQQIAGVCFKETDPYAPVLKAAEARLLLAPAAANGDKIIKTDTKQAYLYCDMGDGVVYIRPPDWWPQPIPEGHVLLLLESIYGTLHAARKWHEHISSCMERNGYAAVNSEKTIFMKHSGSKHIIHGLFVDDIMHIYSVPSCRYAHIVQQGTNHVEVEDAEDYGSLHGLGLVHISEAFGNDSVSLRRRPHHCMRTTPRASSRATTSLADVNEPSTLTSASTLLIK
jgi:hypothetical protein